MSPEHNRKFNLAAGSFFLVMGLAGWGMAVYYGITPNAPKPHPVTVEAKVDLNACRAVLSGLGYQASIPVGKERVRAYEAFSENVDAKAMLDKATMAIGVCKMKLDTFCVGEGCESPGVTFELAQFNTRDAKAKAATKAASKASPATSGAKPANGQKSASGAQPQDKAEVKPKA